MVRLGGSIFLHNAVKYDYCFREAIISLCKLCDEVVVIDATSEDNTFTELINLMLDYPLKNLTIRDGFKWECEREGKPGYDRLVVLANKAKDLVDCDWHFMLQGDEIIHEDSFPLIRKIIEERDKINTGFQNRRINMYNDFNSYIKFNSNRKPCSDIVLRLAKKDNNAVGDAESIQCVHSTCSTEFVDDINIFHYGFVRNPYLIREKVAKMTKFFGQLDERFIKYQEEGKPFVGTDIIPLSELHNINFNGYTHPKFIKEWMNERIPILEGIKINE